MAQISTPIVRHHHPPQPGEPGSSATVPLQRQRSRRSNSQVITRYLEVKHDESLSENVRQLEQRRFSMQQEISSLKQEEQFSHAQLFNDRLVKESDYAKVSSDYWNMKLRGRRTPPSQSRLRRRNSDGVAQYPRSPFPPGPFARRPRPTDVNDFRSHICILLNELQSRHEELKNLRKLVGSSKLTSSDREQILFELERSSSQREGVFRRDCRPLCQYGFKESDFDTLAGDYTHTITSVVRELRGHPEQPAKSGTSEMNDQSQLLVVQAFAEELDSRTRDLRVLNEIADDGGLMEDVDEKMGFLLEEIEARHTEWMERVDGNLSREGLNFLGMTRDEISGMNNDWRTEIHGLKERDTALLSDVSKLIVRHNVAMEEFDARVKDVERVGTIVDAVDEMALHPEKEIAGIPRGTSEHTAYQSQVDDLLDEMERRHDDQQGRVSETITENESRQTLLSVSVGNASWRDAVQQICEVNGPVSSRKLGEVDELRDSVAIKSASDEDYEDDDKEPEEDIEIASPLSGDVRERSLSWLSRGRREKELMEDIIDPDNEFRILEIGEYLNTTLSQETDLQSYLPIEIPAERMNLSQEAIEEIDETILSKTYDGVLLNKLINVLAPGMIDMRAVYTAETIDGEQQILENLQLFCASCRALGVKMDHIKPRQLKEWIHSVKQKELLCDLIWALVDRHQRKQRRRLGSSSKFLSSLSADGSSLKDRSPLFNIDENRRTSLESLKGDFNEETYANWLDSLGVAHNDIENIYRDLSDGLVFLRLMDKLNPNVVEWDKVEENIRHDFDKGTNCAKVVEYAKEEFEFHVVGFGGEDIVNCNQMFISSLLWQMMRYFSMRLLIREDGKPLKDGDIMQMANERVSMLEAPFSGGKEILSLKDGSLCNGLFYLDLLRATTIDSVDDSLVCLDVPEQVDLNDVESFNKCLDNIRYVSSLVRRVGGELYVIPEDLMRRDPRASFSMLAVLMSISFRGERMDFHDSRSFGILS